MVAKEPHHHPVDDITVRTPCEHLYQQRKKIKLVAHGIAEVPIQSGTIHDVQIPEGYARVMVDRVERGWEDLDLEIPGGDGEEELGQALDLVRDYRVRNIGSEITSRRKGPQRWSVVTRRTKIP